MRLSSRYRLSIMMLLAMLGSILYLLGGQAVAWLNTGHGDVVTLLDGMNWFNVLDFRSSKVPLADWPLWLVLLIPSACLAEQCREAARAIREFHKMEHELLRREMGSYRRKGSMVGG